MPEGRPSIVCERYLQGERTEPGERCAVRNSTRQRLSKRHSAKRLSRGCVSKVVRRMSHHNFQHHLAAWICLCAVASADWPYWGIVGPTQYNRAMVWQYYSAVVERCDALSTTRPERVASYTVIKTVGSNTTYEQVVWTNAFWRSPIVWTSTAGYITTNYPALRVADFTRLDEKVDAIEGSYVADWRLTNSYRGDVPWFQGVDSMTNRRNDMPWLTKAETFLRTGVGVVTNITTNSMGIRSGTTFWTKWDVFPQDFVISEWSWNGSAWVNTYTASGPSNYFSDICPIIRVFPGGTNFDDDFSLRWEGNYIDIEDGQMLTQSGVGDADPYVTSATATTDTDPLTNRWTVITSLDSPSRPPLNTGDVVAFVYKGTYGEYGEQPAKLRDVHINERVRRVNALVMPATLMVATQRLGKSAYAVTSLFSDAKSSALEAYSANHFKGDGWPWGSGSIAAEDFGSAYGLSAVQYVYRSSVPPQGVLSVWFGGLRLLTNAAAGGEPDNVFTFVRHSAVFKTGYGSEAIDGYRVSLDCEDPAPGYLYDMLPSMAGAPPTEGFITNMTGRAFFTTQLSGTTNWQVRIPSDELLNNPPQVDGQNCGEDGTGTRTILVSKGFRGTPSGSGFPGDAYGGVWTVSDMRSAFRFWRSDTNVF